MRDYRAHIEAPQARVYSLVMVEPDLHRGLGKLRESALQRACGGREGEHAAMVDGIGVDVQDGGSFGAKGTNHPLDAPLVPPLRDVGDG